MRTRALVGVDLGLLEGEALSVTVPGARLSKGDTGPPHHRANSEEPTISEEENAPAGAGGIALSGNDLAPYSPRHRQGRPHPKVPPPHPSASARRFATKRHKFRKYLARGGWTAGDQALSSLANFVLSVAVARNVGIREFGAFGIAVTAYVLALGLGRACGALPLIILHSGTDANYRREEGGAVGFELLVGVAAGAVCAVVGVLTSAPVSNAMYAIAISLPALVTQDAWRFVFFRRLRPRSAALNDGVWAIVAIGAFISIAASPIQHDVFAYLIGWGIAGVVAAIFGCWQAGIYDIFSHIRKHFRESRSMLGNLIGEYSATVGVRQAALYVVVAGSSLAGAGAFRAGQTLVGPLNVFTQGLIPLLLVEGIAVWRRRPNRLRTFLACAGVGLAILSVLYAFVVTLLPSEVGRHALGASWASGRVIAIPLALGLGLAMPAFAAQTGLRAFADTRRAFYLRLMVGIPTLVGAALGVVVDGAGGAAWGMVIAGAIGAVVAWVYFEIALRSQLRLTGEHPSNFVDRSSGL